MSPGTAGGLGPAGPPGVPCLDAIGAAAAAGVAPCVPAAAPPVGPATGEGCAADAGGGGSLASAMLDIEAACMDGDAVPEGVTGVEALAGGAGVDAVEGAALDAVEPEVGAAGGGGGGGDGAAAAGNGT